MPLQKLQFTPGINKETTTFSNEGGWVDCDKVRFRMGFPEKINGWETKSSGFVGAARALISWQSLGLEQYLGLGTNLKYFVEEGGLYYDITPIRNITAAGDVTFAAAVPVNIIVNSDFSDPINAGIQSFPITNTIAQPWFVTNNNTAGLGPFNAYSINTRPAISPTARTLTSIINVGADSVAYQDIATIPGQQYTFSFYQDQTAYGTTGNASTRIQQYDGGVPGTIDHSQTHGPGTGTQTYTFTATGSVSRVSFTATGTSGYFEFTQVSVIPDVSTVSEVTVTDTNHGCRAGDFVTFSGATDLGGNITAAVLNQEYVVKRVIDTSTYVIQPRTANTPIADYYVDGVIDTTSAAVYPNTSDTGNGGAASVGTYQINTGIDTSVFGTGWGAGTWSRGSWSSAATIPILIETLRLWQHDTFGEDLIMNIRNDGIYYWDASVGTSARAVALEDLPGASNAPVVANKVIVSDIDRHVIAFGANPLGATTQDPLLIRFSDQEDPTNWTPSTTNTAGDLRIGTGSEIVTAVETRQQILIFTDKSLHTMQYLGPPYTFGVQMVAENITIRSPNAAVAIEDRVYWMGATEFMVYTGAVQNLNCTLKEYVFDDINLAQTEKVFAAANTSYGEVWWFYPSGNSLNIDKYVVYNYEQNIWYHGTLNRSAWVDAGLSDYPIATGNDGRVYFHEFGLDADGEAISSYIESSPLDIGEGDKFSFVDKILPDVSFRNSDSAGSHSVNFNLKGYNYNGGNTLPGQDNTHVVSTSGANITEYDGKKDIRVRGRSIALTVSSNNVGTTWRLGSPRINIRTDGKR